MNIHVVISGRSYDQASAVPERLQLDEGATVDDALAALGDLLGEAHALPPTCLVALSGRHLGTLATHTAAPLRDGDELILFAPVAGG